MNYYIYMYALLFFNINYFSLINILISRASLTLIEYIKIFNFFHSSLQFFGYFLLEVDVQFFSMINGSKITD